ncbi:hypothetical protein ABMA28_012428 [Loxostege sticticalis]|uniref:CCHC-type domain-containing protein n=1 Tax=Loxostege sticticalis TaxID=481309 RepID=A0ABD0S3Y3_LOXSC
MGLTELDAASGSSYLSVATESLPSAPSIPASLPESEGPSASDLDSQLDELGVRRPPSPTEDSWSESEAGGPRKSGRRESILPPRGRRTGVAMDEVTVRANELLQFGLEALQNAGNMKRERKEEAQEALQELYVIALSLSDSRSRHRLALQEERTRAARELVRVERAHNRQLAEVIARYERNAAELAEKADGHGRAIEGVRGWLNFELAAPIALLEPIKNQIGKLRGELPRAPAIGASAAQESADASPLVAEVSSRLDDLARAVAAMTIQLRDISLDVERWRAEAKVEGSRPRERSPPPTPSGAAQTAGLQKEDLDKILEATRSVLCECRAEGEPPVTRATLAEELRSVADPLMGQLRTIRTELGDIADGMLAGPARADATQGLGFEIALGETKEKIGELLEPIARSVERVEARIRNERPGETRSPPSLPSAQTPVQGKSTYANIVRTPRFPVIVESRDPRATSQDVLGSLKNKVDVITLGVGVSSVHRLRDQRVAVNCDTEESQRKFRNAIKESASDLNATTKQPRNPLVRLIGVAGDLNDAKLVDAIKCQNSNLLVAVPDDAAVRVQRRAKGRTPQLSNVILEVDPPVWSAICNKKVRVGYQTVMAVDQSPIVQCYRCLTYGHLAKDCKEKETCGYCAGNHDTRGCPNREGPPRCRNCVGAPGEPLAGHPAYSHECPQWQRWDAIARRAVRYC